jgi:DNA modification methylase
MTLPTPYYQDDYATIYNADCRELLADLPDVDLVLTDPPYGIGEARANNPSRSCLAASKNYGVSDWDDQPIEFPTLWALLSVGRFACCFGGNYYPLPPSPAWLIWDKENGKNDFADCELAWSNYGIAARLKRHIWHGMVRKGNEPRLHPTQKPLAVMLWAILLCPDSPKLILDPFAGSGTTLRAAKDLGRRAIGIEREAKYCEIAAKRLEQGVLPFAEPINNEPPPLFEIGGNNG